MIQTQKSGLSSNLWIIILFCMTVSKEKHQFFRIKFWECRKESHQSLQIETFAPLAVIFHNTTLDCVAHGSQHVAIALKTQAHTLPLSSHGGFGGLRFCFVLGGSVKRWLQITCSSIFIDFVDGEAEALSALNRNRIFNFHHGWGLPFNVTPSARNSL